MKISMPDFIRGCLAGMAALLAPVVMAANFTVSPVRVELSPRQPSYALTVRNESADEPVIIQLQTFAWSQSEGREVYTPSTDILATPPIFTIPAGGAQIIRVAARRPAIDGERAFRLMLREVPGPRKPELSGVQIALEMNLPVFVKPQAAVAPLLEWSVVRESTGRVRLTVGNRGNAHVQVANLILSEIGSEAPLAGFTGFAYVLPGQERAWSLDLRPGTAFPMPGRLHLKAYSDASPVDTELVVQAQ